MAAASREAAAAREVIVFAGPNGSGKSTINQRYLAQLEFKGAYVNADDIAKTLVKEFPDARQRNIAAAQRAESQRLACLDAGESFAFETVMSTPEKVALLSQARTRGYQVSMVFVTTSDPEINVARVQNRVRLGGHPVAADSIRSRYEAAMRLLPVAIEQADLVLVFDNSRDAARGAADPILVATKYGRGQPLSILDEAPTPAWVNARLREDWGARIYSLFRLAKALRTEGYVEAPAVSLAEASNGVSYTGRIVAATALHLLQELQRERFLVHARQLLQDRSFKVGGTEEVRYAYEFGKIAPLDRDKDR